MSSLTINVLDIASAQPHVAASDITDIATASEKSLTLVFEVVIVSTINKCILAKLKDFELSTSPQPVQSKPLL